MAPNGTRNRAKDFEEEIGHRGKDFDPETSDEDVDASEGEDGLEDDVGVDDGREHYVDVGKSKLRKPKDVPLGPQYRGSKVRRDDVSDDDEDDPFGKGFDEDESDVEEAGGIDESSEEEDEDAGEGSDDETPDTDLEDDEETTGRKLGAGRDDADYAEARKAMADEQRKVAATLSQASQADAEKGRAVKRQRTAFDGLLGARMKLQKGLIGANTVVGISKSELEVQRRGAAEAISAAESAALNLWSTLNDFREDLIATRAGEKRKRSSFSSTTPTSKLWARMLEQEEASQVHRTATLQKWSAKTRGPTAMPQRSRLNNTVQQSGIMDVIQEQLSNSERLVKRAHTPRSCAPTQVANKVIEDSKIYDDADFYGLLLKELLEQKSSDSVSASNLDLSFQIRRDAKTKKNVDTKASKGRKLRYTVHEKLQNFTVPEDRGRWGERQTDELFGSLFGQRLGLGEDEKAVDADEEVADGVDPAEAGLMLFRG
ncbi:hypothetical protein B0A50_08704 [Salinomyces thailandicus]|uniref:Protein BFR2 n=1 Tax=Salinomyces thailandicus TaxID=706561 RepID=A0A4U0TIZ4_9PEZI|nr:hypothetical protein B0A50_08704 [Salinomyces thailandica]